MFKKLTHGFDTVLIDEAAQASEVDALTPLQFGCTRCVLVGDPQQLPATVLSREAAALNLQRSLFERLQVSFDRTIQVDKTDAEQSGKHQPNSHLIAPDGCVSLQSTPDASTDVRDRAPDDVPVV